MDASRRPGTQTESRSRTVQAPYDPVHAASNGPVPTMISQRHFMHRHQGNMDSAVSVVEAITHMTELYPGFQPRLPGPASITNVGLSSVAHQPFVQLHPPTESWLLPGMASHPLLPVTFPQPNHRPAIVSPLSNDYGPGRDPLGFIAHQGIISVGHGITRQVSPMPSTSTEPEHGNMERERERNSLQADRSHPPIWARSYLAPSAPHVQVQGSNERQHDNNPQQPPTNTHDFPRFFS
ncbi:unnamed protein product [Clonostachys rosea]|uniref:Uncharacterized protein n=1 Tax=Bionectria ochroleuca TaxID=29856 RepID=A0ABY6USX0_BIOOC|nr:unnamed protein product [Clonostachys rosea]